jgi:hypothetical protein
MCLCHPFVLGMHFVLTLVVGPMLIEESKWCLDYFGSCIQLMRRAGRTLTGWCNHSHWLRWWSANGTCLILLLQSIPVFFTSSYYNICLLLGMMLTQVSRFLNHIGCWLCINLIWAILV